MRVTYINRLVRITEEGFEGLAQSLKNLKSLKEIGLNFPW